MKVKPICIKEYKRDIKCLNADGTADIKKLIYKKYLSGKEEIYLYDKDGKILRYIRLKASYMVRFIEFVDKKIEVIL